MTKPTKLIRVPAGWHHYLKMQASIQEKTIARITDEIFSFYFSEGAKDATAMVKTLTEPK